MLREGAICSQWDIQILSFKNSPYENRAALTRFLSHCQVLSGIPSEHVMYPMSYQVVHAVVVSNDSLYVSDRLDPDQARHFVQADLDPNRLTNCLQILSANNSGTERVKYAVLCISLCFAENQARIF